MPAATRLTVHPGEDVLLPAGATLAELREPLANLLRRPELRHVPLYVDGVEVAPGSVVGERPLLPGVVLGAGPTPPPDDAVLRAPWLVARTTGPEAGGLARLARGAPLTLPGGVRVLVTSRGNVRVTRTWSGRGRFSGAARGGRMWRSGSSRRPVLLRASAGRARRLGPLGRQWRPGDVLDVGDHLALFRSGDASTLLAGLVETPAATRAETAGPGIGGSVVVALLPAAGSIGLAVALRQPAYALFALMGGVTAIPQVAGAVRRRRAERRSPAGASPAGQAAAGPPGPARPDAGPGALRTTPSAPGGGAQAPDPAWLARAVLAALHAPGPTWHAAVRSPVALTGPPPAQGPDLLPDGALAVRGGHPAVSAAARAVVAALIAQGAYVQAAGSGRERWAWCRWHGVREGRAAVLVVDGPSVHDLELAHAAHRDGVAVVLLLPSGAPLPSWCRAVLDVVGATGAERVHGPRGDQPFVGVSNAWADLFARRLAGVRALGRDVGALRAGAAGADGPRRELPHGADPADARLPSVVPLGALLGLDATSPGANDQGEVTGVTAADRTTAHSPWPRATLPSPPAAAVGPWAVPLGVDAEGRTVTFDLVDDGPHLLVAGTTGAGKSELLQALVLALALRRTPDELALALIDFKGGASFGACADLPHVVGQVTDLDAGLAARALEGLRAELRRRKEVLATYGVGDVVALPAGTLPRLVVAVDEFRALADDLPDLLPGLLRVAAQGRSLGVHLVLATQRPAGAVSADVRANVSARIALRVVDVADSHDVLDSPAAARVPAGVPGRAVLRIGSDTPVALQCAYAGAAPDSVERTVRRAPTWADHAQEPGVRAGLPPGAPHGRGGGESSAARGTDATPPPPTDLVAALVARARAAAPGVGPRWPAPWLPPLPAVVHAAEVVPVAAGALPLALGDAPSAQARVPVAWDPASGHLAILGRARSGRTTALRALAQAALARGWHVHALVPASAAPAFTALTGHPCFGTLTGPDDPRRAGRLLRLLQRPDPAAPQVVVVVDGVEGLRSALTTPTDDLLATALATGTAAFAVTAEAPGVGGLSARFGPRLVLLSADAAGDAMLGAPSPLAGRGRTPGRGVWLGATSPLECQVALPRPTPAGDGAASTALGDPPLPGGPDPVRVLALPRRVDADALRSLAPAAIGIGGDDAAPLGLDVAGGALVVGQRGSGRTSALRAVLGALPVPGSAIVVARDRGLATDAERLGARVVAPAGLRALLAELEAGGTSIRSGDVAARRPAASRPPHLVLIDDADVLAQAAPLETDRLADLAADGLVAIVATATTLAAALTHRGLLAHLRAGRTGMVLSPGERGADEVFGTGLDDAAEPGVRLPGRGALVVDGVVQAIQLAAATHDQGGFGGGRTHHGGVDGVSAASSPRPRAA